MAELVGDADGFGEPTGFDAGFDALSRPEELLILGTDLLEHFRGDQVCLGMGHRCLWGPSKKQAPCLAGGHRAIVTDLQHAPEQALEAVQGRRSLDRTPVQFLHPDAGPTLQGSQKDPSEGFQLRWRRLAKNLLGRLLK